MNLKLISLPWTFNLVTFSGFWTPLTRQKNSPESVTLALIIFKLKSLEDKNILLGHLWMTVPVLLNEIILIEEDRDVGWLLFWFSYWWHPFRQCHSNSWTWKVSLLVRISGQEMEMLDPTSRIRVTISEKSNRIKSY